MSEIRSMVSERIRPLKISEPLSGHTMRELLIEQKKQQSRENLRPTNLLAYSLERGIVPVNFAEIDKPDNSDGVAPQPRG